jgi:hypothetical protein
MEKPTVEVLSLFSVLLKRYKTEMDAMTNRVQRFGVNTENPENLLATQIQINDIYRLIGNAQEWLNGFKVEQDG